jgi:hypothetical protein
MNPQEGYACQRIPKVLLVEHSKFLRTANERAAAYFEKATLELDESSARLAATIETVLRQGNTEKA